MCCELWNIILVYLLVQIDENEHAIRGNLTHLNRGEIESGTQHDYL